MSTSLLPFCCISHLAVSVCCIDGVLISGPYHDHFTNGETLAKALNRTAGFVTTLPCTKAEESACEEVFASSTLQADIDVILIYADTYENVSFQPRCYHGLAITFVATAARSGFADHYPVGGLVCVRQSWRWFVSLRSEN